MPFLFRIKAGKMQFADRSLLIPSDTVPSNNVVVANSMRLLFTSYTGPVVRLNRSSDNVQSDFYTDSKQTFMTTGQDNTGTSLTTWLNGATGFLVKLYDQSKGLNHIIPFSATTCYVAKVNNIWVLYPMQSSSNKTLSFTNEVKPSSMTVLTQFSYNNTSSIPSILSSEGGGNTIRFDTALRNGNSTDLTWTNRNNAVSIYANGVNTLNLNNSLYSFNSVAISITPVVWTGTNDTGGFTRVTQDGLYFDRSIYGFFTEVIIYNVALSTTNLIAYYTNRLL